MKRSSSMPASNLKIGLILDTSLDTAEGVPQYVSQIGEWLRGQGNDVHYLVGETHRSDLKNIHSLSKNVGVSFNGSRTTIPLPTSRRKLRRFMRQHRFDVLHVQTPHHPLLAQRLIMAAPADTAVVGTFHILPYGWPARAGNRLLGLWLRPSLKRIDTMLAVSAAAAEFCQQTFKVKAEVLPNVVDYGLYNQAEPLPKYDDAIATILFLGRLQVRKGCLTLLEAVAQLDRAALPAFRVVVCGKGHLEAKLRRFIADNQLDGVVELAGYVSEADKPRYYASADLAVFPSSSGESFGIVLLEAMAAGRAAVLAGDNPGYRSVMQPRPELLFRPGDPAGLADKLAFYLKDATARQAAAAWGADYASGFDVNVVGQKLVAVYRQALLKKRVP